MDGRRSRTFSIPVLVSCLFSPRIRADRSNEMICLNMFHSGRSNTRGSLSRWCVKYWAVPVDGWMKCTTNMSLDNRKSWASRRMATKALIRSHKRLWFLVKRRFMSGMERVMARWRPRRTMRVHLRWHDSPGASAVVWKRHVQQGLSRHLNDHWSLLHRHCVDHSSHLRLGRLLHRLTHHDVGVHRHSGLC